MGGTMSASPSQRVSAGPQSLPSEPGLQPRGWWRGTWASRSRQDAVRVIHEGRMPWEYLPDSVLHAPEVWDALIDTIGMTALVRNLARMTRIGTLRPMNDATQRVAARLTDQNAVMRARIHPVDVWLAMRVYASGRSQPDLRAPVLTWVPVPAILDALEEAFELSFGAVEPSGKRLLIAVDSSGSMPWRQITAGGSPLGTSYQVGCAMAVMLARIERGNVHVIEVDNYVHPSTITARTNLREVATWTPSGVAPTWASRSAGHSVSAWPWMASSSSPIMRPGQARPTRRGRWTPTGGPSTRPPAPCWPR